MVGSGDFGNAKGRCITSLHHACSTSKLPLKVNCCMMLIIFDQHVAICFESTISFQLQITCMYIHDLAPNSIKMRHMIFFLQLL